MAGETSSTAPAESPAHGEKVAVTFTGGFETDAQDRGRPVVLVAAALGVPAEVFRDAFRGVTPAPAGEQPDPEQVRRNKRALLKKLAPYGVTNDRLDEVSNYYRYQRGRGEMWRHTPAAATATVRDGVVTEITITNPGAGYSSAPEISVAGVDGVQADVVLDFNKNLKTNGSIKQIKLGDRPAPRDK